MTQKHYEEDFRSFYDDINHFDLIRVIEKDGSGKEKMYFIDGIVVFQGDPKNIGFTRVLADTMLLSDFVSSINEETCTIRCGKTSYELVPFYKKEAIPLTRKILPQKIYLDTLLSMEYLDASSAVASNNSVFIPVSLEKVRSMTKTEQARIARVIERSLKGTKSSYQCSRLPAFSIEFLPDEKYNIYGHIYSIDTDTYLNSVLLYSSEEFSDVSPFSDVIECALTVI